MTAGIELGDGIRSPYPKGLLIGQVIDFSTRRQRRRPDRLPPAGGRLDQLEYVLVITDYQGGLPPTDQQPRAAGNGRRLPQGEQPCLSPSPRPAASKAPSRARRRALPLSGAAGSPVTLRAMKGIVLAGGTATRLYPLTIVTNKHLLPIYDRPMIYYPIETLAGMGIREVLVVVGGKSVGDVVELLGDGSAFGLDLTYRYQPGALGIAHAIGLARDFVGDDAFCCVLGDNILRGAPLADVANEFEDGTTAPGRCSTASRIPSGSVSPSSTPTGTSSASKRSPSIRRATSSRSASTSSGRTPSRSSMASCRRVAASSRSPTCSTTTSRWARCSAASTRVTGPTPAPCRPCCAPPRSRPRTTPPAGSSLPSPARWPRTVATIGRSRHLLVTGGAGFIGSCYVRDVLARRRRHARHRPRQADVRRQRGEPRSRSGTTRSRPPASRFVRGDIADPAVVVPLVARGRRRRQLRRRIARRPVDPRPGGVPRDRRHRRPRPSRGLPHGAAAGRASSRFRPTRSTARSTRATPPRTLRSRRARRTRPPRPRASCLSGATSSPMASMRSSPAARTRTGPYHHPEKLIPLFITNAIDDAPLPLYGDGLQRRDWLYVADHAAAIDFVLRHGVTGETYNVAGNAERTNRDVVAASSRPARQALVARPHGRGPARPRPPLRDGRLEARRSRLAGADVVRGRPGGDRGLVPGERSVVARHPVGRLGRLVRAPVRASGSRPARRGRGERRTARPPPPTDD